MIDSQDLSQTVVPTSLYLLRIIRVVSKFVGLACLGKLLKMDKLLEAVIFFKIVQVCPTKGYKMVLSPVMIKRTTAVTLFQTTKPAFALTQIMSWNVMASLS